MKIQFEMKRLEQLSGVVSEILPLFREYRVVLLYGEMGSGKTTLVQEILRQMDIPDPEGSPTYSLVTSYDSQSFGKIYHLDLYRLKNEAEAYDMGIEEILDGNSLCFIEWPQKIEHLLDGDYLELQLETGEDFTRSLKLTKKAV